MTEQAETRPQETLECKLNEQKENFSFSPPLNLNEECKWLLGVTSFERTNYVFNITDEKKCFSITIPSHWQTEFDEKIIDELNKILELMSLELHLKS